MEELQGEEEQLEVDVAGDDHASGVARQDALQEREKSRFTQKNAKTCQTILSLSRDFRFSCFCDVQPPIVAYIMGAYMRDKGQ